MLCHRKATGGWRRGLWAGWFGVLLTFSAAAAREAARPNVILVMPDQMRGQAMGVAGNGQVRTPNLDRLASQGAYLPNMIANNPVCCPARATVLTGRYPHQHGLLVNDLRLRESAVTLAEVLADAGYATGFVGKWHLDGGVRMPGFIPPGPRRQGFQFWAANQCNHRHFDSVYFHDTDEPITIDKFEPVVWTDEAIRFIEQNRDRPFFLWWTCGPPHNPYKAPPSYEARYDPDKLKMRPNWKPVPRCGSREDIASYYAMIEAIDDEVGRLAKKLDELDLTKDTILLFFSDHGDMLGSHGTLLKTKPYEESICVPGVIRYPRRIEAGRTRDVLFSHVDIAPTILSWCGVKVPETMVGRDLSGLLSGQGGSEPEAVYLQIYEPRQQLDVPAGWRGVRTKRYTYARLRDKTWVLFDNEADPYQMSNLADKPDYADLQDRLDRMVKAEMERTADRWDINLTEHRTYYRGPAQYDP